MNGITAFFTDNLIFVYFFYGLAFFTMGLAVAFESRQSSELSLAWGAWLLAAFGVVHGAHEWFEMFIVIGGQVAPLWLDWLRVAALATSYLFLLIFGIRIQPRAQRDPGFTPRMAILAIIAYVTQVAIVHVTYQPSPEEWVRAADVLARYSLCIPGGTLASLALLQHRRAFQVSGMGRYGNNLVWAAGAMACYAIIGQSFVPSSVIFPSMFVNTSTFVQLAGFPIQVFRASMAGVVALAMIRTLRAFEAESQLRLERAHEAEQRGQEMLLQLNRELQTAARELSLLYEASRLLTTPLDLQTLLKEAIAKIVNIVEPIKAGSIVAQSGGTFPLRYQASYGYRESESPRPRVDASGTYFADGFTDVSPLWLTDTGEDVTDQISGEGDQTEAARAYDIHAVALPLGTRRAVLGYLILETDPSGPYLSALEAPTIKALARQLAVAIENAALLHETRLSDARRGELLQRITAAQEAERQRIARELHDETGQALTGMALALSSVGQLIRDAPEQAIAHVTELRDMCTHAINELRHLINFLRPSQLDDLGLVAALRWHIEQTNERSSTDICFAVMGTPRRLPPETETTLFRIAQEGLNNIVKHANAKSAAVHLEFLEHSVKLHMLDDGRGFHVDQTLQPGSGLAWGLVGIQERATLAGGYLSIDSTPGRGTCLELTVPDTSLAGEVA